MKTDIAIAGAGIGGLAAALVLAQHGLQVAVFDQAERLAETGAGIQLSPNAAAALIELGVSERLRPMVVAPRALRVRAAGSAREIVQLPLGEMALARYGSPYWVVRRSDLQKALLDGLAATPRIRLTLGARVESFAIASSQVQARITRCTGRGAGAACEASALIGADGLWSAVRDALGDRAAPRFARRVAWRAMVPASRLDASLREPEVTLWLGPGTHLVHYPVAAGQVVNIVAVAAGSWESGAWSTAAARDEVLARFAPDQWGRQPRELLASAEAWQKWALYDRPPATRWGEGPVTLLGDAAHPMLPFLAQGAAMAIEDALVLGRELARSPDDPARAFRAYETTRLARTARAQRAARRNDLVYHLPGPAAFLRDVCLRALGGERLLAQYDWLYRWRG